MTIVDQITEAIRKNVVETLRNVFIPAIHEQWNDISIERLEKLFFSVKWTGSLSPPKVDSPVAIPTTPVTGTSSLTVMSSPMGTVSSSVTVTSSSTNVASPSNTTNVVRPTATTVSSKASTTSTTSVTEPSQCNYIGIKAPNKGIRCVTMTKNGLAFCPTHSKSPQALKFAQVQQASSAIVPTTTTTNHDETAQTNEPSVSTPDNIIIATSEEVVVAIDNDTIVVEEPTEWDHAQYDPNVDPPPGVGYPESDSDDDVVVEDTVDTVDVAIETNSDQVVSLEVESEQDPQSIDMVLDDDSTEDTLPVEDSDSIEDATANDDVDSPTGGGESIVEPVSSTMTVDDNEPVKLMDLVRDLSSNDESLTKASNDTQSPNVNKRKAVMMVDEETSSDTATENMDTHATVKKAKVIVTAGVPTSVPSSQPSTTNIDTSVVTAPSPPVVVTTGPRPQNLKWNAPNRVFVETSTNYIFKKSANGKTSYVIGKFSSDAATGEMLDLDEGDKTILEGYQWTIG